MSELLNRLQPAMRAFFQAFLHGNQRTPDLQALKDQAQGELEITVGQYLPYDGYAANVGGYLLLPHFGIHVDPRLVYFTMSGPRGRQVPQFYQADGTNAPPPGQGGPPPGGTPPAQPPAGPNVTLRPYQYSLVRVHERIDPMLDDQPTMERLFADLRDPNGQPASPAGITHWARSLLAMRQANAAFFEAPLEALQQLPSNAPTNNPAVYKQVMYTFATYLQDGRGTYYTKQNQSIQGEDGRPVRFPMNTTEQYRRLNTEEIVLEPNKTYCLVNVPASWALPGGATGGGEFREVIFRLEPQGNSVELHPVSFATRVVEWGGAPARDVFDFCFFVTGTEVRPVDAPLPEELIDTPPQPPPR